MILGSIQLTVKDESLQGIVLSPGDFTTHVPHPLVSVLFVLTGTLRSHVGFRACVQSWTAGLFLQPHCLLRAFTVSSPCDRVPCSLFYRLVSHS